jgi:hypothetical protein
MRIIRGILSLTLAASAFLGVQILSSDGWLWSAASSHAYGLIGFVTIDVFLVVAVQRLDIGAVLGAAIVSATQFGAMLADLVAGQPEGVPSISFRAYLTTDASYVVLLIIQVAILIVAVGTITMPLWQRHAHWPSLQKSSKPVAS